MHSIVLFIGSENIEDNVWSRYNKIYIKINNNIRRKS